MELAIHPKVYDTGGDDGLLSMLENAWINGKVVGEGTIYIISGFANFNGGTRFYKTFKNHTEAGGRICVFLGGSKSQRLASKQVVEALLECGAEVNIINRKRLMHSKMYGLDAEATKELIVSSGNFTGPGMTQNVEASLKISGDDVDKMNFDWGALEARFLKQSWQFYQPQLDKLNEPVWKLLYDETPGKAPVEDTDLVTLVIKLGHADTVRIQADKGSKASLGSQYFWLSKDSFGFFPALTIKNNRGWKGTFSTIINLSYIDLGVMDSKERVTFEANNNSDFRLGTGKFRYSKLAAPDDFACITRVGEEKYEVRIIQQSSKLYHTIAPHLTDFIGHQGKRYGFIDNSEFYALTGLSLDPSKRVAQSFIKDS